MGEMRLAAIFLSGVEEIKTLVTAAMEPDAVTIKRF